MTGGRPAAGQARRSRPPANGWQGSIPELVISVVLIAGICVAAYGYAGAGASALVLVIWAVVILLVLRVVMPDTPPPLNAVQENWQRIGRSSFLGFWRKRGMLNDAATSMVSYDAELRATLQHLLAARLADRHGISLYGDPDAARRLLLRSQREQDLWFWLDPRRPAETRQGRRGIPPQTLAAIIDRLERL
jgi:hypothetical protein